ncbi:MAG: hypothetical protein ACLR7U_03530 [Ruthenibacterium lactatiformans]
MSNLSASPASHRADVEARPARPCVLSSGHYAGLGLAPLIVAATTLKNGVMLSVAVLLLLTPTRVLAALLSRCAFRFRGLTYALTAAAVFVGVRYVMGLLYPVSDLALRACTCLCWWRTPSYSNGMKGRSATCAHGAAQGHHLRWAIS